MSILHAYCFTFIPILPTLRPRLFPSIGLTVTSSSIDVVIVGDDLISSYVIKNLTIKSFHIDGCGFYLIWGTTSSLPRLCSLEYGRMVHIQGRFYCMNYNPFSVLAYDIAANNWWRIQAPMRRFIRSPSLVESRGRLIIVATVENSKLNVPKKLEDLGFASFWNNMGGDWENATTTLPSICRGWKQLRVWLCRSWRACCHYDLRFRQCIVV